MNLVQFDSIEKSINNLQVSIQEKLQMIKEIEMENESL